MEGQTEGPSDRGMDRQIGTVVEEWTDQWRDRLAQIRLTLTEKQIIRIEIGM